RASGRRIGRDGSHPAPGRTSGCGRPFAARPRRLPPPDGAAPQWIPRDRAGAAPGRRRSRVCHLFTAHSGTRGQRAGLAPRHGNRALFERRKEDIMTTTVANIATERKLDYFVKDLSLAEWGRKEIRLAEQEMPGLMALREEHRAAKPLAGQRI